MRAFTDIEKRFIRKIVSVAGDGVFSVSQLLAQTLFADRYNRALILQTEARFAVLYIHTEVYSNAVLRRKEISLFLDILSLIQYLRDQRYISLFIGTTTKLKPMYYWQDGVTYPVPKKDRVVLNKKGDYTEHPEFIYDRNDRVIYHGTLFDTDAYDMMADNLVGSIYVSRTLRELAEKDFKTNEDTRFARQRQLLWGCIAAMTVLVAILAAVFLYRVHDNTVRETVRAEFVHDSLQGIAGESDIAGDTLPEEENHSGHVNDKVTTLYGIDVSRYNGNVIAEIDERDSISFMICKATEGITITDPDFLNNWHAMRQKGMITGAYHFYRVGDNPHRQANHFWSVIQKTGTPDIAPIVDIEQRSIANSNLADAEKIEHDLLVFLNDIERKSGRIPMIYTDVSFANAYLVNDVFARYPLWLAEYTRNDAPIVPHTWRKEGLWIWQKKDSYNIDSHPTDFDVFFGDKADLYQ